LGSIFTAHPAPDVKLALLVEQLANAGISTTVQHTGGHHCIREFRHVMTLFRAAEPESHYYFNIGLWGLVLRGYLKHYVIAANELEIEEEKSALKAREASHRARKENGEDSDTPYESSDDGGGCFFVP
jgi:hypothetical protein